MIEFFNARMQEAKLNTAPGNPVIAAQINLEQNFAFIEVNVWLCFDGDFIDYVSILGTCTLYYTLVLQLYLDWLSWWY